ncbi:MAG TPA: beta-ketoacyl synthase N-terminal-like domain-containing protein, partial [Ktedonosporobacter sp.]|nr:beta-ketoacyl synthase N-terminal-like domain-containing protein [Ktedonosporobacter sp.]
MPERIPVLVGAARTPTGKFLSNLASFTAPQLGAIAIKEAVRRAGIDPATIDEVIMGNVVSAGIGQAPARQAAIQAGLPVDIPAFTINKVCGSGLKAVMLAAQAIRAGDAQAFVAGGMESINYMPQYQIPYTSAWGATSEGLENEDAKAARRFPRNAQTAEVILAV